MYAIRSYYAPGSYTTGLTFDGRNIWLADRKTDLIYCIDPSDGKVVRSIKAPAYWPTGLACVITSYSIHYTKLYELRSEREVFDFLAAVSARYGIGFWKPGAGIIHQSYNFV